MIRLTILLSAYNCEKYIGEAVQSILNQDFMDFELIIADDSSNDKTKEIIDSFTDKRIIKSHNLTNKGKTETINRLFELADSSSEFVTIHDGDDISLEERFRKQMEFLDLNPDFGLLGCSFECIKADGSHFSFEQMSQIVDDEMIEKHSVFHGPTVIFRKSLLAKNEELYRPFFQNYNEDCDLMYRLFQRTKGTNLGEILYKYRILPNALSKELSPRKKVMYQMVSYLAAQRKIYGQDSIQKENFKELEDKIEALTAHYIEDKSKILREQSAWYMYYGLNKEAISASWKSILQNPSKLDNWRTFQYCLRKSIFKL